MALIEAAFESAARPIIPLTRFPRNVRSINSITLLSKRRFSNDIEDLALKTRKKGTESLYHRFRRKIGLFVTDVTASEWCEKQKEFTLFFKPKPNEAMRKGSARHTALEEEVIKKVKVPVTTSEDRWAVKFMNFIEGSNQLLFDGLTRELPLLSYEEGVWMVGVIDEIRMPVLGIDKNPTIIDTKTRVGAKLPSEPQQRNGRLQLMCYKRMWDNLVAGNFPAGKFFDSFGLDPNYILSTEIRESTAKSGYPAETLNDLVVYFRNACNMLSPAQDQLLLRYELQEDQSLLGEDQFPYDGDWLDIQVKRCLEFWLGKREPTYAPEDEQWKCKYCSFSSDCPGNANLEPQIKPKEKS